MLQRSSQDAIEKLLDSIQYDISSLEERPVVELMNALTKVMTSDMRMSLIRNAEELFSMVHTIVTEMAVNNTDLVDSNFIMDYLNSVSSLQFTKLDSDKTQAFIQMFNEKCQE